MRSANEIAGLVLKAARGAGMPLGCAEELARAAPHLARSGSLGCLPALLVGPFEQPAIQGTALHGGHPVLAITSALDLEAAGRAVACACALPGGLEAAMRAARIGDVAVGPFELDQALREELEGFAAKTFVPETEASRLAGAGAGLTDND